jgi:predicted DNA-binding protein with PD1-like motif
MRARRLASGEAIATWVLVLDPGDEVVATLRSFAAEEGIRAAHVSAIGAVRRAVVGWFDPDARDYRRTELDGQLEVLSLIGDLSGPKPGRDHPTVHVHAVLGAPDATVRGGHLFEAVVRPTLEVFVAAGPGILARRTDPSTGLALIDLEPDTTGGSHGQDRS